MLQRIYNEIKTLKDSQVTKEQLDESIQTSLSSNTSVIVEKGTSDMKHTKELRSLREQVQGNARYIFFIQ